jgi:sec-independent protein translocase protein TatA
MELAIVLVLALLVFGPKRLPRLGRQLGTTMRQFKHAVTGDEKWTQALERGRDGAV